MSHYFKPNREGTRYGRLIVLDKGQDLYWSCQCDCGTIKPVRRDGLLEGRVVSCGCFQHEVLTENGRQSATHGHKRQGFESPTYMSWHSMKIRCRDKDNPNYGGAGVKIAERWLGPNGFVNFLSDMGERPPGKTLDRYPERRGDYGPDNCRWATPTQQQEHRKMNGKGK